MPEDIKATLWKSADKLRAQMDAAEYKHIVLGLIFLKYISDTFVKQQEKVKSLVSTHLQLSKIPRLLARLEISWTLLKSTHYKHYVT